MSDYFKRLLWLFSVLFALVLLFIGMSQFGRRLAAGTLKPFLMFWEGCVHLGSRVTSRVFSSDEETGRQERERLMAELLADRRSVERLMEENRQLREALEVAVPERWRAVHAQVILRDPVTWNWRFLVSRGAGDGIRVGNPVLYGDTLIGRVTELHQESATVSTLASPDCRFSVFVRGDDGEHPGIFQGKGAANGTDPPECQVDYLQKLAKIRAGDLVVTSGLGPELPYGIPAATVQPQPDGSNAEFVENARLRVRALPVEDFRKIHFVTILTNQSEIKEKELPDE